MAHTIVVSIDDAGTVSTVIDPAPVAVEPEIIEVGDDTIRHDTPLEVKVAAMCHEANRQYQRALGDESGVLWKQAPGAVQAIVLNGVRRIATGTVTSPADSHHAWMQDMQEAGWAYGPQRDAEAKTHPCLLPFTQLPPEQQAKDHIFFNLATLLLRQLGA